MFLFNHSHRVMLGPFSATSHGGMLIEPLAWGHRGHTTPFPAQVRPGLPGNHMPACMPHCDTRPKHERVCVYAITLMASMGVQVRVVPHEPVAAILETQYKPLLERTMYYGPSAFHFDLTRQEVTVLLQLLSQRRPFGATLPFLAPLCYHPLNPPPWAPSHFHALPAAQQPPQSQSTLDGWLVPRQQGAVSAVQPPPQAPADAVGEPFRFGGQAQPFGLAPTVRLPPPQPQRAADNPQGMQGEGFAAGVFALNGFAHSSLGGLIGGGAGQLANGGLFAPRQQLHSEQPAPAQQVHGYGTAWAPSAAQQISGLANGMPPPKRHRLANMVGPDELAADGPVENGARPEERSAPAQNGSAQSGWSGWAPTQPQGLVSGPGAHAAGEDAGRPLQPQPTSPFAVFAQANRPSAQPAPVPFPGFAQPSATAPWADAAAQPPSPGALLFPPIAGTPLPAAQQRPAAPQLSIFQTPSQQSPLAPPPPSWSPTVERGRAGVTETGQNGGQSGPLPQQEQSPHHSAPPGPQQQYNEPPTLQQQQQQPASNPLDSINALPQVLGGLSGLLPGQEPQLAAVIRAALGATAQLQVALQAILAVLEPQQASPATAAPAATPHAPTPAPAVSSPVMAPGAQAPSPVPAAPFASSPSPQHATPSAVSNLRSHISLVLLLLSHTANITFRSSQILCGSPVETGKREDVGCKLE